MRCFAAVEISEQVRDSIRELQRTLPGQGLRPVSPANLHFTMKFFGECTEKDVDNISQALAHIAQKHGPFTAVVKGIGTFPTPAFIKVVWIGCSELLPLMTVVDTAFALSYPAEKPVPHLTLCRVGTGADYESIRQFVKAHEGYEAGFMNVSEFKLKSSTLTS